MIGSTSLEEVAYWTGIGAAVLLLVVLPLLVSRVRRAAEEIARSLDHILSRLNGIDQRLVTLRPTDQHSGQPTTDPSRTQALGTTRVNDRGPFPREPSGPASDDSVSPHAEAESPPPYPGVREEARRKEPAVFDERRASEIFETWCTDRGVEMPSSVTAAAMSFKISPAKSELRAPTIRFLDKDQIGEFFRLSSKGAPDEGYLFPHPDAAFNPAAHPRVFNLTEDQFKSAVALSQVKPLKVRRKGPSEWESA